MTDLRCVVVNYNAGHLLAECVTALLAQDEPVEVVVVDNASDDQSLAHLDGVLPAAGRVRILRNPRNRGYAQAANRGTEGFPSGFIAFVNPDCRPAGDAVRRLREALEGRPGDALAGAWVTDPDGAEQRGTRRRLPTPWRALMTFSGLERWAGSGGVNVAGPRPAETEAVEAVNGACFLVRAGDFHGAGGFDTGYFLHCEDLDLFRRLRDRGRGLCLVPAARAVHVKGVSSRRAPARVHWHKHRGMMRYLFAHHARGRDWPWLLPALLGLWLHFLLLLPARLAGSRPDRAP